MNVNPQLRELFIAYGLTACAMLIGLLSMRADRRAFFRWPVYSVMVMALGVAPPAPIVGFMTCPVFFSNPGFIKSTGHRMPPGAISVTSSACDEFAAQRITTVAPTEISFFMRQSLS